MRPTPEGATATNRQETAKETEKGSRIEQEFPLSSIEFDNPGKKIEYVQTETAEMIASDMNKLNIDGATPEELLAFNKIAEGHQDEVGKESVKFQTEYRHIGGQPIDLGVEDDTEVKPYELSTETTQEELKGSEESDPEKITNPSSEESIKGAKSETIVEEAFEDQEERTSAEKPLSSPPPFETPAQKKERKSIFSSVTEKIKNAFNKVIDPVRIDQIQIKIEQHQEVILQLNSNLEHYETELQGLDQRMESVTWIKENATSLKDRMKAEKEIESINKRKEKIRQEQEKTVINIKDEKAEFAEYQKGHEGVIARTIARINEKVMPFEARFKDAEQMFATIGQRISAKQMNINEYTKRLASLKKPGILAKIIRGIGLGKYKESIKEIEQDIEDAKRLVERDVKRQEALAKEVVPLQQEIAKSHSKRDTVGNLGKPIDYSKMKK